MGKRTQKKGPETELALGVPTGSEAAVMASLNAEMLKTGVFKMEEGADPHWLARGFFRACVRAWEKYKTEHNPNWSVTAVEIASVAVSLKRQSFLPKNGFEHCDIPRISLPDLAVEWIAGAYNALCVEQEMARQKREYATLSGLNDLARKAADPERPMVPVAAILKLAGCDELKPTCEELKRFGHDKATFDALPSAEKHGIRLDILNKYDVALEVAPFSATNPKRTGGPCKLLPGGFRATNGLYPLSLFTVEHILALRRAKELRIREVRSQAPRNESDRVRVPKRNSIKSQKNI